VIIKRSVPICALLCAVAPVALCAPTNLLAPELTSFAYRRSHPVAPLPPSVVERLADRSVTDDEARAYEAFPSPEARVEQERPMTRSSVCSAVASVARANDLPVPFFANLIWQESNFDSKSVSRAGAQGIAQFMPKTAAEFGLTNPFEPIEALHAAGRFLSQLRAQFGNLGLAAAAYNAGPGRVVDWMGRRKKLPGETRNYVMRITGRPADRWTVLDASRDPEAKLMPAHAPCAEVTEEVARQVQVVRVTRLMSELAAATSPLRAHKDDILVAGDVPLPRKGPIHTRQGNQALAMRSSGHRAATPPALTESDVTPIAERTVVTKPALTKLAAAKTVRAAATKTALARVAAAKPALAKAAAAKPALARAVADKSALARTEAPKSLLSGFAEALTEPGKSAASTAVASKSQKPAAKHIAARAASKRTRVAAAK
jgi:hypothetical protein